MEASNGHFVISLDFEIHWGVIDSKSLSSYELNLKNVRVIIPRLLELCNRYNARMTFATVGFLFSQTKEELLENNPTIKPTYTDSKYNPYVLMDTLGEDEITDPLHYAKTLIKTIKEAKQHEIGTHTYCHYYCLEEGQTIDQFSADLKAAIDVAKKNDIEIKSIVFPRNQIKEEYLAVCAQNGLKSYRGNEKTFFKAAKTKKDSQNPIYRILRLADTYFNISGYHTYKTNGLNISSGLTNIPSSRFLRPYSKKLKILESLKLNRIKKAMLHAAQKNEIYHLWWHPHNFGKNMDENFAQLESIFKYYKILQSKYNFSSVTMTQLTDK